MALGQQTQCEQHWVGKVGGAQRKLPIHVLQEYNNPDRPFDPTPNFDAQYKLVRDLPDWLSNPLVSAENFDFGIWRAGAWSVGSHWGQGWQCSIPWSLREPHRVGVYVVDRKSLVSLYDTRIQQRKKLVTDLTSTMMPGAFKK